ncbi:class I SAM-dependent methyltransferase [Streptomyces sp. NEAU-YJ-81]|uniref:class I SAM-dependent methyltransferase n=1 Tax=Streptomyces sp. NEAU-YJ-81 TaxID=2820288 RepID=UPI001FB8676B|nr:class I SAM-dependent methyltransferase [Streptomyces sp. NEAU-YJ-81]
MAPQDAILGWNEDSNAEAYNAFTRAHPMYDATSRDLARRGHLANASLVVDLCGGAGATARAILDLIPARARVVSVDNAAAMQRVGRRTLTDARLTWITSPPNGSPTTCTPAAPMPWCATPRSGRPIPPQYSRPSPTSCAQAGTSSSTSAVASPASGTPTNCPPAPGLP